MGSLRARTAAVRAMFSVALWCVLLGGVVSFNLDTKIPIVKVGPEKSHFGYSVAQHKTFIPGAPNSVQKKYKSWMLVGAPKGENLQPHTSKSGALFRCPMTTYTLDCEQVQTDGLRNSNGLYKGNPDGTLEGPSNDEIKDDQWMGVTLKSQGEGGDILVCGHRYQQKGIGEQNFRWGYGLCYRLTNDFDYEDNYQPCKGKPVNLEHEQFGYCQAGTSGLILDDEVVLGIPGTYTWRGTVTTRNISDDYLYRDKTQYFGVYTDNDSPVDKYSYLGYSVTAGRFFGNKISYVAGAPRSRGTGQVIFFSRKRMGEPLMNYDLILNGETFASSFGFEVLAMDTNGDKRDDLVVSAPFYFTQQSSGAVYVYLNDGNGISGETRFTRLEGAPGESRFGYSMTSLGDLNLDGYNDLAVGAPYENKGAIYIYLGSENGIQKEPSQVIRAEDLPGLPYEAFGYALSGGMDLDNNKYNDLLTSSFCSDRVILLRARPIIDIQTRVDTKNLQNINPNEPGCPEDPNSPETCFSFKACFKMNNEAGTATFLSLHYNISERYYNDQPTNRIRFDKATLDNPSAVQTVVTLRPEDMGRFQCSREIVYLRGDQKDVLRPVRFRLEYKIHQRDPKPVEEGQPLPDIDDYPILNQKEAIRDFEANFAKDCGDDDVCESDLSITGDLDLEKSLETNRYIFELGKRQFFTLTTTITNDMDPAYLPNLYVRHDKAIDLSIRESELGTYHCINVETGLLNCNLDNPLVNTTGPLNLVFKPSGLPFKRRDIDLIAWVNSTSEEINPRNNRISFVLEVKRRAEISITGSAEPEQAFYSGDVVGESAIKTMDEIGTAVIHKYLVDNRGPWKVDEMRVQIQWPYQTENNKKEGKWLLYMTEIPFVDGDGECDVDPAFINPLNYGITNLAPESEIEISGNERLTGVTEPSISTGTTTSKTIKIIKTSTTKEFNSTIKKTSSTKTKSRESSTSFGDNDDETDDFEGSGAYGTGRTRTNVRVSRKTFSSGTKNRVKTQDKYGDYDYDYETYNNFFDGKENTEDKVGRDRDSGTGYTHREETKYNFRTNSDRLNAVDRIRVVNKDGESYLNGYDKNDALVWTSRGSYGDGAMTEDGLRRTVHSRTEVTRRVYSSSDRSGGSSVDDGSDIGTDLRGSHSETEATRRKYELEKGMEENRQLLSQKMNSIIDFRIMTDGDQTWVNGYDENGAILWSSRSQFSPHGERHSSSGDGGGYGRGKNYESSVRKEYFYNERTRDEDRDGIGETKRTWSSSVTDRDGTRRHNGSSVSEARDFDTRIGADWDTNESSYTKTGYERKTSYSSGGVSGASHGHDHARTHPDDREGSGYSSFRKEYSYRERTKDEDDDGFDETRREWSSAVTDNDKTERRSGSSITDEHGTRVLSGSSAPDDRGRVEATHERDRHRDVSRTFDGYDHHRRPSLPDNRGGSGHSSYRKEYSYRERTKDEDGDGIGETRREWTSAVTDNDKTERRSGSSITDEHGTRVLSGSSAPHDWDRDERIHDRDGHTRKHYSSGKERSFTSERTSDGGSSSLSTSSGGRSSYKSHGSEGGVYRSGTYSSSSDTESEASHRTTDEHGQPRYRFDWNYPEGNRHEARHQFYDNRHHDAHERNGLDESSNRWAKSGGFRDKNPDRYEGGHRTSESENYRFSSQHSRHDSSNSYQPQNDEPLHANTYSRAVFDRNTGNVEVYSQKVFRRKSGDQWQEVHGPYNENEWSKDFHYDEQPLKRTKREREFVIKPEAITDTQTGKTMQVVNFRCDGDVPTAKCFTFQCTIRNLAADQSASIRIPARLWNSTLVEDYSRVSFVSIKSKGELLLPEEIRTDQDESDDVDYAETLAYPNLLEQLPPEEVPLWVILVSVLAGLLLLVLIAIILWKLGFFKRKRPDPTLSGNIDRDVNGYN